MKILHTSDWHLGKRLSGLSRLDEQRDVLNEICDIADIEHVNLVIISGDLFDNFNPSVEANELFYKTVKTLAKNGERAVIAIAGNHDSPNGIEVSDPLARECGIFLFGSPNSTSIPFSLYTGLAITKSEPGFIEMRLNGIDTPARLLITPYANEVRLKKFLGCENPEEELRKILQQRWNQLSEKYCDENGVNLLIAHLFIMKKGEKPPEEPEDEKPILQIGGAQVIYTENIPYNIQYVAMGHLHRKQMISSHPCPIIYCGSPIAYSMSEANQEKYVIIIDATKGKPISYDSIPLKKGKMLKRKTFYNIPEAVEWLKENQNTLVEITLATDTYPTSEEQRQLHTVHNGIVAIIPELKNKEDYISEKLRKIDLTKSMEELFIDYFKYKNGHNPNKNIINLYREILSM
ncbi:MAG: exonuclease sbcCD subunit D [Candidatus Cloacimonadota bacterium]|nr:MAG: exonuclease sbcCD subunit D [Candidatus Cloacimonadota bacterium]